MRYALSQLLTATNETERSRAPREEKHHRDDDDLDAYIKELIGNAPPLTSEQRDKLALLLRSHRRPQ